MEDPSLNTSYDQYDHLFKAELELSNAIIEQVGDGSLVIELEIDTHQQHEGWHEEVTYWTYWSVHAVLDWRKGSEKQHLDMD